MAANAERVVCTCNKVTETAVRAAIADGADSIAALGQCTRAGTGCGSCKGELQQLLTTVRRPEVLEAAS
jgi:nitrite reductase (NADH) large subunit